MQVTRNIVKKTIEGACLCSVNGYWNNPVWHFCALLTETPPGAREMSVDIITTVIWKLWNCSLLNRERDTRNAAVFICLSLHASIPKSVQRAPTRRWLISLCCPCSSFTRHFVRSQNERKAKRVEWSSRVIPWEHTIVTHESTPEPHPVYPYPFHRQQDFKALIKLIRDIERRSWVDFISDIHGTLQSYNIPWDCSRWWVCQGLVGPDDVSCRGTGAAVSTPRSRGPRCNWVVCIFVECRTMVRAVPGVGHEHATRPSPTETLTPT